MACRRLRSARSPSYASSSTPTLSSTCRHAHPQCSSPPTQPVPLVVVPRPRRLQHVFHTDKSLYLAFEFCDSDLKQYMRANGNRLSANAVQSYSWQLINGLTWCHSHGIIHRDLKPQNLLVQPARGVLKIGDFGLTRAFALPLRTYTHEVRACRRLTPPNACARLIGRAPCRSPLARRS